MTGRVVFCYWFSNFKEKGDPMECGSYRAIKLLEHAMKVIEHVFERRIREKVKIDAMQFGFMPGKGTTDAIFTVWQIQEKYECKGMKLYFASVDLEKAFGRVPNYRSLGHHSIECM